MDTLGIMILIIFLMLIIYTVSGPLIEHHKIYFIHESGIAILLGLLLGYLLNEYEFIDFQFNEQGFFYFILPPIVFSGGYNLKRRRFFRNFDYICIFGVFNTIINFVITAVLTWFIVRQGWVIVGYNGSPQVDLPPVLNLSIGDILLFSATLCATDTIAALTLIDSQKYQKLFSVILGEGVLNDAVCIILFHAVSMVVTKTGETEFYWFTTFLILKQFFQILVLSTIIGLIAGLIPTILLRNFRFLSGFPVVEILLTFCFAYTGYIICDLLKLSGIISLLVSGIFMGHYNYYNISDTGKTCASTFLKSLSHTAEGFLFSYLGLSSFMNKSVWSWSFIFAEILVVFISRLLSVYLLSLIFKFFYWLRKKTFNLDVCELGIISFAGMVRGAIAYGLISTIDEGSVDILRTTTLGVVLITLVVLGAMLPNIIKFYMYLQRRYFLLKTQESGDSPQASIRENFLSSEDEMNEILLSNKIVKKDRNFVHRFWRSLDEKYIQPNLIYDFERVQEEKKKTKLNEYIENQKFKLDSHLPGVTNPLNTTNETPERKSKVRDSLSKMHQIKEEAERDSMDFIKVDSKSKDESSSKNFEITSKE